MKNLLIKLIALILLIKTTSFPMDIELDKYSSLNINNNTIEIVMGNRFNNDKYIEYYKIRNISRVIKMGDKQKCRLIFFNNSNKRTSDYIINIEQCNMIIEKYYGKNYTKIKIKE